MSQIASLTNNLADAEEFWRTSFEFMEKWEGYTFEENSTHAKLAYQLTDSWGTGS
jgi:Glutaminase A six helical-hairpin domain